MRSSCCFALASCIIIIYFMIVVILLKIHYGEKFAVCLTGWFSKQNIGALCQRPWFESSPGKTFRLIIVHKNSKIIIVYIYIYINICWAILLWKLKHFKEMQWKICNLITFLKHFISEYDVLSLSSNFFSVEYVKIWKRHF